MAKAIKWQIAFQTNDPSSPTSYRIDIYAEGYSGTPIQLTAGPQPIVTEENDDKNFFSPVRGQTGTIQVCTRMPNGGTLDINDLLPSDNIAHPVRLVSIAANNNETIEWQGFLSCEAYSQAYTEIPEIFSFPVISVLEAMDSMEVELNEDMAFKKILGHVAYAMKAIETKSGMSLFSNVHVSTYVEGAITSQYFYNNVYFKAEELISGDNITVEVHSVSCKAILEQVAKFFGCSWREVGQNFYLEMIGGQSQYHYASFSSIYAFFVNGSDSIQWNPEQSSTANLSVQTWMGTGHQRSVMQGMRRVKVDAKLDDFGCNMTLQECPVNNLVENPEERQSVNGEVHVNTNETFYNLAEHKHYLTKAIFPTDLSSASLQLTSTLSGINYTHTIFWETNLFRENYYTLVNTQSQASSSGLNHYITSFMAWWRNRDDELQSGLMICGVPKNLYFAVTPVQSRPWNKYALTEDNYLFRQRTPLIFAATKGYIKIDINTLAWSNAPGTMPSINYGADIGSRLTIAVQLGSKWAYYDSEEGTYKWSSSFHTIDFQLEHKTTRDVLKTLSNWDESMGVDKADGLFINIPEFMAGFVSVRVYPYVDALCTDPHPETNAMFDVFISKLDVEYVPLKEELLTDRSDNAYATETSQAFRDELSLNVDLASYANNTKLATMIWDDATTPAKLITLGSATVRPEVDLLNRLASYYGAARQRLELEVAHPTAAPLPLLKLNGINDGKVYLPLSESRDWQTGVCKLTCFETPTEQQEEE